MKCKANVYLAQTNNQYGSNVFLPYSVGMLQAYVQSIAELDEAYCFKPLIFLKEDPEDVARRMEAPAVLGLSSYIWNWEWNKALATAVRKWWPDCWIIMGGPQVPQTVSPESIGVDVFVHGEGELAFAHLLTRRLYESCGTIHVLGNHRAEDINIFPSPYLAGIFDKLIEDANRLTAGTHPNYMDLAAVDTCGSCGETHKVNYVLACRKCGGIICDECWYKKGRAYKHVCLNRFTWNATQETHRGCPYSCTFCDWGSAVFTKTRQFSTGRIEEEYEWMSRNRIELLYNADANYGLFPRDEELNEFLVDVNRVSGYPRQIRAAWAKNTNKRVFRMARALNASGMNKGVTLALQSLHGPTLEAIKRQNIKFDDFASLSEEYQQENIPAYIELILGLPEETYDSFASGIEKILEAGQHGGLNIYLCALLPNSEMSEPSYIEKHGIKWVHSPLLQQHSNLES